MMNQIPTAEEFALYNMQSTDMQSIESCLIAFTKLHVKAALEAAYQKATFTTDSGITITFSEGFGDLDKDSILNAYDLNQIK